MEVFDLTRGTTTGTVRVPANTEDNTTVPFTQNESGNVLNLTVVQEAAAITY